MMRSLAPVLRTPTPALAINPQARRSYLAIAAITRRHSRARPSCLQSRHSSHFSRSDFASQPFSGSYEPGQATTGPLGSAPLLGAPRLTPRMLKEYLDQYVVGQDRAKRVLSVAVYNHYLRVQDIQRREHEEEALLAKRARRESVERQAEDDVYGHPPITRVPSTNPNLNPNPHPSQRSPLSHLPEPSSTTIEKSNVLLLGPSGTGKTLMAKTLARILDVPFSMSDCTPFTQAGYIGEDADVCVQRLLAAADYNVEAAERGIICLDEVDKIATAKVSHGKDVSGEGVQQALLKIIEGTTVQVQAKPERGAPRPSNISSTSSFPTSTPSSYNPNVNPSSGPAKGEVYNVRTDNILFICSGAFIGLGKIVMDRISRGSIGFGQPVRAHTFSDNSSSNSKYTHTPAIPITTGSPEEALYKKHLPFYASDTDPSTSTNTTTPAVREPTYFNPLDLTTPSDLQTYGFIPEFTGRIPITASLSPLTHTLLYRILTEPQSSLISQYTSLFALSGIDLRFTTPALHQIATNALLNGAASGARALRTELELILADAQFEAPGASVKFVVVGEKAARREERVGYFARGQGGRVNAIVGAEEREWEERVGGRKNEGSGGSGSFEEWRGRASGAGG